MAVELYRMGWPQRDIANMLAGHLCGIHQVLRREIPELERVELKRQITKVAVERAARKRRISKNRIRVPAVLTMRWA